MRLKVGQIVAAARGRGLYAAAFVGMESRRRIVRFRRGEHDFVALPLPAAFRRADTERCGGGDAPQGQPQIAAHLRLQRQNGRRGTARNMPRLPAVSVILRQPQPSAAGIACGVQRYFGGRARKDFRRHLHLKPQAEQLGAVLQHGDDDEAQQPECGDIGEIGLIIQSDQPQQGHHNQQPDAQTGRYGADVPPGRRFIVPHRRECRFRRPHD